MAIINYKKSEMYSQNERENEREIESKKKEKEKENTFRSNEPSLALPRNVCGPSAHSFSHKEPTAFSEKESVVTMGFEYNMATAQSEKYGYIPVNRNDYYTQIDVQVTSIKPGVINRATVYFSLKREQDRKFNIFLVSATTSKMSEITRGAKKKPHLVHEMMTRLIAGKEHYLLGRIRYKAPKKILTNDFHRNNLLSGMCCLYTNTNTEWSVDLLLLNELYTIELEETTNKQKQYYALAGSYINLPEIDDTEE